MKFLKDEIVKVLFIDVQEKFDRRGFLCEKDLRILVNDKFYLDYGVGYFVKKFLGIQIVQCSD